MCFIPFSPQGFRKLIDRVVIDRVLIDRVLIDSVLLLTVLVMTVLVKNLKKHVSKIWSKILSKL